MTRQVAMDLESRADAQIKDPEARDTTSVAQDATEHVDVTFPREDIRSSIRPSEPFSILDPPSGSLATKLGPLDAHSPANLYEILHEFELAWTGPFSSVRAVFRLGPDIIIKAVRRLEDMTEYTTLQYLERNAPHISAPRPLGAIRVGAVHLLFMTCIPGTTLGKIWQHLSHDQRVAIQDQLEQIMTELRSLDCPPGTPLGGVAGEGCKDLYRSIRFSKDTITTAEEFEQFKFSDPIYGSKIYIDFLRGLSQAKSSGIVFTHGDVRPDNIMVDLDHDGQYVVTGLIDWEFSGFYPEHHESTKVTNCLGTNEDSDWYFYVPHCISPAKYSRQWLLDRLWGAHITR